MKARYTTRDGRVSFEVEGQTPKEVFRELAAIQEVFDAEAHCGVCGRKDIRFLARKVDDYDFYELACGNPQCRARFAFGQAKKGGNLFPKRRDDDGNPLPHGGWEKWQPKNQTPGNEPLYDTAPASQAPAIDPTIRAVLDRVAAAVDIANFSSPTDAIGKMRDRIRQDHGTDELRLLDHALNNFYREHPDWQKSATMVRECLKIAHAHLIGKVA